MAHFLRKIILVLCVLGLALVCMEGAIRLRQYLRFGVYLEVTDLFWRLPGSQLPAAKPNLNVYFGKRAQIETDSRGFRSPELALPKPQGTLRLAFVGASTTFCSEVSSNAKTWPSLVSAALCREFPDIRIDFANAGVSGNRVEHSQQTVELRLTEIEPDVIVIYDATNDLAVDSKQLAIAAGLAEVDRLPSRLEGWSLLWRLWLKNQRYSAGQERALQPLAKLKLDPDLISPVFKQRLTALVRAAQSRAKLVVLITFATQFRADQALDVQLRNLRQSFTFMPYLTPEDTLAGYAAYNRVICEVAEECAALLVDERELIPGDSEHFTDSVHFSDKGCEVQAERVLRVLLHEPRLLALVEEKGAERAASTE